MPVESTKQRSHRGSLRIASVWLGILLALGALGVSRGTVLAQTETFCPPGQAPRFVLGFAELKGRLGVIVGDPVECEHYDGEGNAYQKTTTGELVYRKDTNTATFIAASDLNPSEAFADYTIEGLRARQYPGGSLQIRSVLTATPAYTRYYIAYPSDDLTITGVMHVPTGKGPFPVVILNHGYIRPSAYWSGADTWRAADYLARRGYLTIAPDFRGWGGSDQGEDFFRSGLAVDVLNLISSLPSVPQADPNRIGMWGHSMGGGVTTKAITVDPRIKAAVLYAPVSADEVVRASRWRSRMRAGSAADPRQQTYRRAMLDDEFLRLVSPIHYVDLVAAPVQIHQGTADTVTPPEWAGAIRDALQRAGKEVEFFSYEGDGHALRDSSWLQMMERVAAFFGRSL